MAERFPGPWVCGTCGSARIGSVQPSLGDPVHPLGYCAQCNPLTTIPDEKVDPVGHRDAVNRMAQRPPKTRLSVLLRPEEWEERQAVKAQPAIKEAIPPDMWADQLPADMRPKAEGRRKR